MLQRVYCSFLQKVNYNEHSFSDFIFALQLRIRAIHVHISRIAQTISSHCDLQQAAAAIPILFLL